MCAHGIIIPECDVRRWAHAFKTSQSNVHNYVTVFNLFGVNTYHTAIIISSSSLGESKRKKRIRRQNRLIVIRLVAVFLTFWLTLDRFGVVFSKKMWNFFLENIKGQKIDWDANGLISTTLLSVQTIRTLLKNDYVFSVNCTRVQARRVCLYMICGNEQHEAN